MSHLVINGGQPLNGEVAISGAKNAALPILAATVLTGDEMTIRRVPSVLDTRAMVAILQSIGMTIDWQSTSVRAFPGEGFPMPASVDRIRSLRASICLLGPLLARFGRVELALPGGCEIGERPIDMHIEGMRALGAEVQMHGDLLVAAVRSHRLRGAKIDLRGPHGSSVLATANVMMAGTMAIGQTVIINAAQEPEVLDLANCLRSMGATIHGAGTDKILIEGTDKLHGTTYEIIPDRIETGTLLLAVTAAGGKIQMHDTNPEALASVLTSLRSVGTSIQVNGATISASRRHPMVPVDIVARPYPGFPTDLQPLWAAAMAFASGECVIRDEVFPNRFRYVAELRRMGCNIVVDDNRAIVKGVSKARGAIMEATDLRASAALVVAALATKEKCEVWHLDSLDRGYERFEATLSALGANVVRLLA